MKSITRARLLNRYKVCQ